MPKFGFYQTEHKNNNFYSFLQKQMWEWPDKKILKWVSPTSMASWDGNLKTPIAHESIQTKDLGRVSSKLANKFLEVGIRENDIVVVYLPLSFHLYATIFALVKIGAIPTTLDCWNNLSTLGKAIAIAGPRAMISYEKVFAKVKDLKSLTNISIKILVGQQNETEIEFKGQFEKMLKGKIEADTVPVQQEHSALVTFETDFREDRLDDEIIPRGANRTHHVLAAQLFALKRHIELTENDSCMPLFPMFGLYNIATGTSTTLPCQMPDDFHRSIQLQVAQIYQQQLTTLSCSPSHLKAIFEFCHSKKITLEGLQKIFTAGAPLTANEILKLKEIAPNANITFIYGDSEVDPMSIICAKEILEIEKDKTIDKDIVQEGYCVGKFDKGISHKILQLSDKHIEITDFMDWMEYEVKSGQPGELVVAGEHVCPTYWGDKDDSSGQRYKIRDDFGITWHRTGELAKTDEQGRLWILGRVVDTVCKKNEYINSTRAEIAIRQLPYVQQAAYIGLPNNYEAQKSICVVSSPEYDSNKEGNWQKEIRSLLTKNNIPVDEIQFHQSIPLKDHLEHRVDYDKLRENLTKGV